MTQATVDAGFRRPLHNRWTWLGVMCAVVCRAARIGASDLPEQCKVSEVEQKKDPFVLQSGSLIAMKWHVDNEPVFSPIRCYWNDGKFGLCSDLCASSVWIDEQKCRHHCPVYLRCFNVEANLPRDYFDLCAIVFPDNFTALMVEPSPENGGEHITVDVATALPALDAVPGLDRVQLIIIVAISIAIIALFVTAVIRCRRPREAGDDHEKVSLSMAELPPPVTVRQPPEPRQPEPPDPTSSAPRGAEATATVSVPELDMKWMEDNPTQVTSKGEALRPRSSTAL